MQIGNVFFQYRDSNILGLKKLFLCFRAIKKFHDLLMSKFICFILYDLIKSRICLITNWKSAFKDVKCQHIVWLKDLSLLLGHNLCLCS